MMRRLSISASVVAAAAVAGADVPALPKLSELRAPVASEEGRREQLRRISEETIGLGVAEPLYDLTEKKWEGALWGTLLTRERERRTRGGVEGSLKNFMQVGAPLRRQALETAYGVFPQDYGTPIGRLLPKLDDPKLFAMATLYLMQDRSDDTPPETFAAIMEEQFPDWRTNPILLSLRNDLDNDPAQAVANRPPLAELFAAPGFADRPVVFSLQRVDRRWPGIAVVRRADGRFARNADGSVFHIPHLALSISNLPGYITNGNTPEGVFSTVGTGVSQNEFIGPTPFLHTTLPGEIDAAEWTHGGAATELTLDDYRALLPESWRGYRPFEEAWYAGQAGRNEIIAHGTTTNPDFYLGEACYPISPSLGCLTAMELWSPVDGAAVRSDQLALLNAYLADGDAKGWLVVVDLDAKAAPVTLAHAVADIDRHEATLP